MTEDSELRCGIFHCPADTPVDTIWYSSLEYDYVVVERGDVRKLERRVHSKMPGGEDANREAR